MRPMASEDFWAQDDTLKFMHEAVADGSGNGHRYFVLRGNAEHAL